MKPTTKNIIIGVVIIALMLGIYYYFINNSSKVGSLISSTGVGSATALTDKINEDTAFLSTLIGLSGIKIDTSIFSNQTFSSLVDNHVKINSADEGAPGRPNPFAPIDMPVVLPPSDLNSNTNINTVGAPTDTTVDTTSNNTNIILNRLLNSSNNKK